MTRRASQSRRDVREIGSAGEELEPIINELAADQAAARIVLQSFLLRVLSVHPEAAQRTFAELHDHVFRSIDAIPLARDDEVGAARWKRLVAVSADKLLGEIGDTLNASVGEQVRRKAGR